MICQDAPGPSHWPGHSWRPVHRQLQQRQSTFAIFHAPFANRRSRHAQHFDWLCAIDKVPHHFSVLLSPKIPVSTSIYMTGKTPCHTIQWRSIKLQLVDLPMQLINDDELKQVMAIFQIPLQRLKHGYDIFGMHPIACNQEKGTTSFCNVLSICGVLLPLGLLS